MDLRTVSEMYDAVMLIRPDAACVDEKSLPYLCELPIRRLLWCCLFHVFFSQVLLITRPISLLVCLSNVFEVLMARQIEGNICCDDLLTVFQSGFYRHHSTVAAVLSLRETEHIRLSMEDGQVAAQLLLDFYRRLIW
jgi:hypothetical protein